MYVKVSWVRSHFQPQEVSSLMTSRSPKSTSLIGRRTWRKSWRRPSASQATWRTTGFCPSSSMSSFPSSLVRVPCLFLRGRAGRAKFLLGLFLKLSQNLPAGTGCPESLPWFHIHDVHCEAGLSLSYLCVHYQAVSVCVCLLSGKIWEIVRLQRGVRNGSGGRHFELE